MTITTKVWRDAPPLWQPGDPLPPDATPIDAAALTDLEARLGEYTDDSIAALPAPTSGDGGAPILIAAGNLGAAHAETVADGDTVWLIGVLNVDCAFTANLGTGSSLKLLLDNTAGSALTINGPPELGIPTADAVEVDLYGDGTNVFVDVSGAGPPGVDGVDGADGVGIPPGGTAGQALTKASGADFDTQWSSPAGGAALADCARAHATAVQSIASTGDTFLTFDAEDYDFGGFHDAANPTRFTSPVHAIVSFGAVCEYAANVTGKRELYAIVNRDAARIPARDSRPATVSGQATRVTLGSVDYELAAGEFVEFSALQTSGAALNTVAASVAAWIKIVRAL